jgi:hypothetical protein
LSTGATSAGHTGVSQPELLGLLNGCHRLLKIDGDV